MAVAVSSGSTILDAKVCLMGMVNMTTILFTMSIATATGYVFDNAKAEVSTAAAMRDPIMVLMSPNLATMRGMRR